MHAKHPELADKWEKKTPDNVKLPEKVKKEAVTSKTGKTQKSKGHIAFQSFKDFDVEFYVKNGEVYRAPLSSVFENGYRIGRWECSVDHAIRYASVLGLKPEDIKRATGSIKEGSVKTNPMGEGVDMKSKKLTESQLRQEIRKELALSEASYSLTSHGGTVRDWRKADGRFDHALKTMDKHIQLGRIRNGGYVEGKLKDVPGYTIQLVVFEENSQFGINGGQLSKLWIFDESNQPVIVYDRGWSRKPKDPKLANIVKDIANALKMKNTMG